MNKGFLIYARSGEKDYIKSAYALALSIRKFVPNSKISLVTDAKVDKNIFDNIIEIPWMTDLKNSRFKTEDRWKLYHCSPYEHTIVLDADMLVLSDINHWWDYLKDFDIFIPINAVTYRNEIVTNKIYREAFYRNNLPDMYSGILYFKKGEFSKNFYTWLELINTNWEYFYGKFITKAYPEYPSMDLTVALATSFLGILDKISNKSSPVKFTHMKPAIQNWESYDISWQRGLQINFNKNCRLKVGSYVQSGVFHYTEDSFLQPYMIKYLETI